MYNGARIKELLMTHEKSNKELLNYLGIECNSSISQLVRGNPSARKLEKVADFFGVSIEEFFIRDNKEYESKALTNDCNYLKDKIKLLEKLIAEKDKVIALLEENLKAVSADKTRTNEN